jgi:hypothetical protein
MAAAATRAARPTGDLSFGATLPIDFRACGD